MKKILFFLLLLAAFALNAETFKELPQGVILPTRGNDNDITSKMGDNDPENDKHLKWFSFYKGVPCILATDSDGEVHYLPKDVMSPYVHVHPAIQIKDVEKLLFNNCVRANVADRALTADKAIEAGIVQTAHNTEQAELALTTPHAENGLAEDVLEGTTPIMKLIEEHKIWAYEDILIPPGGDKGQIMGIGVNRLSSPQKGWINSDFKITRKTSVIFGLDENENQAYIEYPKKLKNEAFDWMQQYTTFPLLLCMFSFMAGFLPNLIFMVMVLTGLVVIKDGKLRLKKKVKV
jgi:hypothetical protein